MFLEPVQKVQQAKMPVADDKSGSAAQEPPSVRSSRKFEERKLQERNFQTKKAPGKKGRILKGELEDNDR